jgi:hypothetical protein
VSGFSSGPFLFLILSCDIIDGQNQNHQAGVLPKPPQQSELTPLNARTKLLVTKLLAQLWSQRGASVQREMTQTLEFALAQPPHSQRNPNEVLSSEIEVIIKARTRPPDKIVQRKDQRRTRQVPLKRQSRTRNTGRSDSQLPLKLWISPLPLLRGGSEARPCSD